MAIESGMNAKESALPSLARRTCQHRDMGRLIVGILLIATGCTAPPPKPPELPTTTELAEGVVYEHDSARGVSVLDIDLQTARYMPVVIARNVTRVGNNFVGDARTVGDWMEKTGAIAAVNGGFFGDTYAPVNGTDRKQIVGLSVVNGIITTPGTRTLSTRNPGQHFLRGAVGFTKRGVPDIAYATATRTAGTRRYTDVLSASKGTPWAMQWAVQCGPRLYSWGQLHITDREERLISAGELPRTAIAYDLEGGKPHHLVLLCAEAMTFAQTATYLAETFVRRHGTPIRDALCLDGGGSTQMAYRVGSVIETANACKTTVPTAILLVPRHTPSNSIPATPDEAVRAEYEQAGGTR